MTSKHDKQYSTGETGLQKLKTEMEMANLQDQYNFMRWFEEESVIDEEGFMKEAPMNRIDEQDHLSEREALKIVTAIMFGSMWEQKEPCHIVRKNLDDEQLAEMAE